MLEDGTSVGVEVSEFDDDANGCLLVGSHWYSAPIFG